MDSRDIPAQKIHEYGSNYRCPKCHNIVSKYAKYCESCGQRLQIVQHIGIEGWCAEK